MDFDQFLKAVLPPMGYNWRRHRRKGVRRKLLSRISDLGLDGLDAYHDILAQNTAELASFKDMLAVTISRFYRDPNVFDRIKDSILPWLISERGRVSIWSAGAASGEEPYTLAMIARENFPGSEIRITATDIDSECMSRANAGVYGESSLRQLPRPLKDKYFTKTRGGYQLCGEIKSDVPYIRHNIVTDEPLIGMDMVLCRNLVYTYFKPAVQMGVTWRLYGALRPGGFLVLGRTESLPPGAEEFFTLAYPDEKIYKKKKPSWTSTS